MAVVGTGASAIQFVPEIAKVAAHVDVYQRSAPYVLPKADRPYRDGELALFDRVPAVRKAERLRIFLYGELLTSGFVLSPKLLAAPMAMWRRQLRTAITDPELRARCVPDYVMGCKRVVFSNDWYPALARPDVELVTEPIERIVPDAVVTADGAAHPADVIIYGTGFGATQFLTPMQVSGRGGRSLRQAWRDGAQAYLGITVAGFPNFFMLYGPNTNLGGNSIIYMLEGQIGYVLGALQALGPTAWPGSTCAPTSRTRSTTGCSRPAAPRCGRAAATAGTPCPAATPTTGPTTRSCTAAGSAASTWPPTASCPAARPGRRGRGAAPASPGAA